VHLTASIRPGAPLLPRLDGADGVTGAERLRTLVTPSASNLSTEPVGRPSQPARRRSSKLQKTQAAARFSSGR
jgi:hypothetical protein